jgi:hypothetical protein
VCGFNQSVDDHLEHKPHFSAVRILRYSLLLDSYRCLVSCLVFLCVVTGLLCIASIIIYPRSAPCSQIDLDGARAETSLTSAAYTTPKANPNDKPS